MKLVAGAAELLTELASKEDWMKSLLVFPSPKNQFNSYDFSVPFEKTLKLAGIEDFHWHDLRHCVASFLVMSGVPDQTIMKIMGWKSKAMLERYTHLTVDHVGDAQELMAEKYLPSLSKIIGQSA